MRKEHRKGCETELLAAFVLTKNGFNVSFPFGTQSRYDLVVEKDNVFYKVQVKTASWSKSGVNSYLQARLSSSNLGNKNKVYQENEVDFFFISDSNRSWLIPFKDVQDQTSVCLDSSNPNYKIRKKYNPNNWII